MSATGFLRATLFLLWSWGFPGTRAQNIFRYTNTAFKSHPPKPPADITVGAYYYPWYYRHFEVDKKGFNVSKEGYVRRMLVPRQEIRLGEYDDRQVSVIEQHLEWSRQANIKVWVSSWWGPNTDTDAFLRDLAFLPAAVPPVLSNLNDHKIAILYETTGRIKESEGYNVTKRVPDDFEYICNNKKYTQHPNYYKINGRPVIVIYLTRLLDGKDLLDDVIPIIREKCKDVYIIGDQVWGNPPTKTLDYLDAITNYDVYGNMGRPKYAEQSRVDQYYNRSAQWKNYAAQHKTFFVPAVSPGFNDRGVRLEANHTALSRRLAANSQEGTLFAAQLVQANKLLDPGAGYLLLVNSFNEWHEDTQIEPCDGLNSTQPYELTGGLQYVGYGTLYLDILATYTSSKLTPVSTRPIVFTGKPVAKKVTVGAYYWSWLTEEHFETGLRGQLDPPQTSTFSLSADPIPEDLRISWQANIRLWITPWEKEGHTSDVGARSLFNSTYLRDSGHKLALHYYVKNRVDNISGKGSNVYKDVSYLCGRFFKHASYYRTSSGNKPVLFIGLTRALSDSNLTTTVNNIRMASTACGEQLYLVGDQVWGPAPMAGPYFPFSKLDAVMNHDVFGYMDEPAGYAGSSRLDKYYEEQRQWRIAAWNEGTSFVPTVIPGFNDRAARTSNMAMSRILNEGGAEGSFFNASLDKAKHLLNPELDDMILIHSLNHFQEDTQIYPVCGKDTDMPMTLTQNLTYAAYESLYLDLMKMRFGSYHNPSFPTLSVYACPSPAPSLTPSASPKPTQSAQPSSSPSTPIPSLSPSTSPSQIPSAGPSINVCFDSRTFVATDGRTCATLKQSNCGKTLDSTGRSAIHACPIKCGKCTPRPTLRPTPPPTELNCTPQQTWQDSKKTTTCLTINTALSRGGPVDSLCAKANKTKITGYVACPAECNANCRKVIVRN